MLLLNCCDFLRNGLLGSYGNQTDLAAWGVVQKIGNGACLIMGVYTVFCIMLVNVIPEILISLFLPIEEVMPIAVSFLRKWTLCIVGVGYLELLNSIFQAMGRWKISMANVVAGKAALMAAMLLLVRVLDIIGVIVAQPITDTMMAIVMFIVYFRIIKSDTREQGD